MGPLSVFPVCLSVCDVRVPRPNGWMDRDATWYGGSLYTGTVLHGAAALPTDRGTVRLSGFHHIFISDLGVGATRTCVHNVSSDA